MPARLRAIVFVLGDRRLAIDGLGQHGQPQRRRPDVLHDPDVKETMKKVVKKAVKAAVKEAVQDAQEAEAVKAAGTEA